MTPEANFRAIAPAYMARLVSDFSLNKLDAAAVFGNAGHESLGFTKLQEIAPTVKGSKGGYGWFQWTGPRRRAYEAYCTRNKLDPAAPDSNYAYLFVELKGDEKAAIAALRKAVTLNDKVIAFEAAFLRAGVKHYPERERWAAIALDCFPAAIPAPAVKTPPVVSAGLLASIITFLLSLIRKPPQ